METFERERERERESEREGDRNIYIYRYVHMCVYLSICLHISIETWIIGRGVALEDHTECISEAPMLAVAQKQAFQFACTCT